MDGGRPRLKIADGVPEWVICHRASERRPACAAEQRVDAGTTFNEIVTAGTDDGVVAAMADQPVATVATKNVVTPATEAIEVIGAPIAAFDDSRRRRGCPARWLRRSDRGRDGRAECEHRHRAR